MFEKSVKFTRVLTLKDFGLTSNITVQPNIFNKIGEFVVPAGQLATFGVGSVTNVDTREVCYLNLSDGTNNLNGIVRFVISDPNEVRKIVVAEQRTERLRASQNDKTQGFLLAEYPVKAKEDSKLIIEFKPDSTSAVTISATASSALIPATIYQ